MWPKSGRIETQFTGRHLCIGQDEMRGSNITCWKHVGMAELVQIPLISHIGLAGIDEQVKTRVMPFTNGSIFSEAVLELWKKTILGSIEVLTIC